MQKVIPTAASSWRTLFRLAGPVVAEEVGNMLVGYVDWYLAGRFLPGAEYQAAMALLAYALWLIPSFFSLTAIGSTAMIARAIGRGDESEARRCTAQSLRLGALTSLAVMFLTFFGAAWFTRAMQLETQAAELVQRYLAILLPVLPLMAIQQTASACLRAAGDTRSGFLAKTIVNTLNAVISFALVTGSFGCPLCGWEGLAIGTAVGHAAGGFFLLAILLRRGSPLRPARSDWRYDHAITRRLLKIGLPGGVDQLAVVACHLIYVAVINRLGNDAAAAHGLGLRIEALSFTFGSAFYAAAATLAGQALGAGEPARATRDVARAALAAAILMSTAGIAFYVFGPHLTAFFNGGRTDAVSLHAADLLKIVAWSCPFLAVLTVNCGGLRGGGDTRVPLVITLAGLLGVRVPLAAWLAWSSVTIGTIVIPGWNLGVEGAWIAMVIDVVVRCGLLSWRFLHGGWRKIEV